MAFNEIVGHVNTIVGENDFEVKKTLGQLFGVSLLQKSPGLLNGLKNMSLAGIRELPTLLQNFQGTDLSTNGIHIIRILLIFPSMETFRKLWREIRFTLH